MDLVVNCVTTKYATFSGRAPRKEYWLFVLAGFIFGFIAAVFDIVTENIGEPCLGIDTIELGSLYRSPNYAERTIIYVGFS